MTIGVDFDGTIVEDMYPKIGDPIPFAIETLLKLKAEGHVLLLWTVREGKSLQAALDYCAEKGLTFHAANKNYPEEKPLSEPRKLKAHIFIDDRCIGGLPDWGVIYRAINGENTNFLANTSIDDDYQTSGKKKNFFIRLGEAWERAQGRSY